MDTIHLYTLQMQSRLLEALDMTNERKQQTNNQQNGSLDFSDLLNACLATDSGIASAAGLAYSKAESAVPAVTDTSGTSSASIAGSMQISDTGIRFIANHEGYSATAYRGADSQNQTIGYGHVLTQGETYSSLTQPQAYALLKSDLSPYETSVNKEFSGTYLTQNQFNALVSFSYNLGTHIWSKVPQLTNDIKNGASADVLKADFERVSYCNGRQLKGLVNRRLDEFKMFEGNAN